MFPAIFDGDRVRLAAPRAEDQAIFAAWTRDDDYMRLLDDDPVRPHSPEYYDSFGGATKDDDYYFHLRTIEGDELIGFVVLFNLKWRNQSAEMAIGIGNANYRGKGFGNEALRLLLNYAFTELCLHRVSLTVLDYNIAAIKAYERVGFTLEGAHRQAVQRNGQFFDLLLYGILQEEWRVMQET